MGFLARVLAPPASKADLSFDAAINHPSWGDAPAPAWSGANVTSDSSQSVPIFRACVSLVAETLAALPLHVYRERDDGGRDKATDHPLYRVLRERPNERQDAFEFWEMVWTRAILRGNFYGRKVLDRRGNVAQIIPIHPDSVRKVEWTASGGVRYTIKEADRPEERLLAEDVFHVRYKSLDGLVGCSVVGYARQTLGLALAAEEYGARFFGNGGHVGAVLQHPGSLSEAAQARLKADWESKHAGLQNAHRVAVLEEGMEYRPISVTQEDAQYLETREFQNEEICRLLRVPPTMVGLTSKSTSWGSGIEQQFIGWVATGLLPWVRRGEQAIGRQLLTPEESDAIFAAYVLEGLIRGDTATRYAAYAQGRQWGWFSANDVRRLENLNPIEGGDTYLMPVNMVDANAPPEPAAAEPIPFPAPDEGDDAAEEDRPAARAHYELLLHDAAARIVNREIVAMRKAAARAASDADGWRRAVDDFYGDHIRFVAETLRITYAQAGDYCAEQSSALLERGVRAMDDWETTRTVALVALALGQATHGEGR